MENIAISKFKATCLSLLERVKSTKEPILITKKGSPIAQVVPPPEKEKKRSWFGCMENTIEIKGDIVNPVSDADWEAVRS